MEDNQYFRQRWAFMRFETIKYIVDGDEIKWLPLPGLAHSSPF